MKDEFGFEYTYNPSIANDCNGFITPDGTFYIISNKSEHIPTHEQWASKFILYKTNYIHDIQKVTSSLMYAISRLKNKSDILMHIYGYIYFSYSGIYSKEPLIIFPDEKINDKKVTDEQKNMLFDIAKLSGEDKVYYYDFDNNISEDMHNSYVQKFISRRIEEEGKK